MYLLSTAGSIERMGFEISRYWGKDPFWFESQDKDLQIKLLADYRLSKMDSKTYQKEKRAAQVEQFHINRNKLSKNGAL